MDSSYTKYDLAQYLVNLHTLLMAQEAAGGLIKNQMLLDEYNRNWVLLKATIAKENDYEARNRNEENEK